MPSRSTLGLLYTLQGIENLGFSCEKALEPFGMSIDSIDPAAEIDRALELEILNSVASLVDDPVAGLKIGSHYSLAGYGPFTMMLMTCKNVWNAFQVGVRYQEMAYLWGHMSLEPHENYTCLVIKPVPLPPESSRFLIDRDVSGTWQLLYDMQANLATTINPEEIWLPYPEPPEAGAYEKHFNCRVLFDKPAISFRITNDVMKMPFISANKTGFTLYQKQCDEILAARKKDVDGLSGKVRHHLDLFVDQYPCAADVATTFGIPERSFRRKLSSEGTSFREILDRKKYEKAVYYLKQTSLPIEQIASRLGYAESAAFNHAFQRWSGTTPGKYRKQ